MSKHSAGLAENTKTILDFQRSGWNPIGLGLERTRKAAPTVAPSSAPWRQGRIGPSLMACSSSFRICGHGALRGCNWQPVRESDFWTRCWQVVQKTASLSSGSDRMLAKRRTNLHVLSRHSCDALCLRYVNHFPPLT